MLAAALAAEEARRAAEEQERLAGTEEPYTIAPDDDALGTTDQRPAHRTTQPPTYRGLVSNPFISNLLVSNLMKNPLIIALFCIPQ